MFSSMLGWKVQTRACRTEAKITPDHVDEWERSRTIQREKASSAISRASGNYSGEQFGDWHARGPRQASYDAASAATRNRKASLTLGDLVSMNPQH
ncbi:hypothetical protein IG631_02336 [Alternaria alternata]|nr:hypothetical protein IG631_02336 [Alternaria alternata]